MRLDHELDWLFSERDVNSHRGAKKEFGIGTDEVHRNGYP